MGGAEINTKGLSVNRQQTSDRFTTFVIGWTPLDGIDVPRWQVFNLHNRGVPEMEISTIGLDLTKNIFQAHGAGASGAVAFQK